MNPNTRMSADWIRQAVASNPLQKLENGNWRTPPVRLAFTSLFKPEFNKNMKNAEPKHGTVVLFPAGVDYTAIDAEIAQFAMKEFPDHYNAQVNQFFGLVLPFRDGAEKSMQYDGYMAGQRFCSSTSKFRPQVLVPGAAGAWVPVTDESKVYPGVWAILTLNIYSYGKGAKGPEKKGVGLGLQNVLIIADDNRLGGGGGSDPAKDFGGVQISQDTNFQNMMGSAPTGVAPGMPGAQPAAMGYMPPAQPVNTLPIQPLPATPSVDDLI